MHDLRLTKVTNNVTVGVHFSVLAIHINHWYLPVIYLFIIQFSHQYAAREADIIAQAGRKYAITISTNMAGRGTDIILGGNPKVCVLDRSVFAQCSLVKIYPGPFLLVGL